MPLEFTKMNENDLYDADRICNRNFDYLTKNVLPSGVLTKLEYDNLANKIEDKLYAVKNGDTVQLYLGKLPVTGGGEIIKTAGEAIALPAGLLTNTTGIVSYLD